MCSVAECSKLSRKRDLCEMHYRRWRLHGDVTITKKRANGAGYYALGYTGKQINGVRKFDHVRIIEDYLGHDMPKGWVIHHLNGIKDDNRIENLFICKSKAEHNRIHADERAGKECGNSQWRKCRICKQYDCLENLRVYPNNNTFSYWHKKCTNKLKRKEKND